MKKFLLIIILLSILPICFSACVIKEEEQEADGLHIITTIFPAYDFAKHIVGNSGRVDLLLPPGAESHSYELTPKDIISIQNSNLFVYVGGVSDEWLNTILSTMEKPVKTFKLMDSVEVLPEEIKEGMEDSHHHEKEEIDHSNYDYDEHVWTSPVNAIKIIEQMTQIISQIDPDNKDRYINNSKKYTNKLTELDNEFRDLFDKTSNKTLIFADRFPFRYFTDEYKLPYYAAFPGCAAQAEPSASTIAFLIDKIKQEDIPTVFYIEFSNQKTAESISSATGVKTALLHSCHNITKEQFESGITYLDLMQGNLKTLEDVLK